MKQVYQTKDGKTFDTKEEAHAYEVMLSDKSHYTLDKVMNCYSVKKTIDKYGLSHIGTWKLTAEDPNCDWGGYHHQPLIGYYKGTLASVVKIASEATGFFNWGYGGSIEKIDVSGT